MGDITHFFKLYFLLKKPNTKIIKKIKVRIIRIFNYLKFFLLLFFMYIQLDIIQEKENKHIFVFLYEKIFIRNYMSFFLSRIMLSYRKV